MKFPWEPMARKCKFFSRFKDCNLNSSVCMVKLTSHHYHSQKAVGTQNFIKNRHLCALSIEYGRIYSSNDGEEHHNQPYIHMRGVIKHFEEPEVSGLQWWRDAAQWCTDFVAAFVPLSDLHNSFSESALKRHRKHVQITTLSTGTVHSNWNPHNVTQYYICLHPPTLNNIMLRENKFSIMKHTLLIHMSCRCLPVLN